MDKKRKKKNTALPLLLAALTLAGAGLWWGNYTLSTEEYAFTSRRLPEGWDGARIVVLSDLHGRRFGRDNSRLLKAVRKARPDIIALAGDLVDEWSGTEYLRPLLRGLTAMAPTYFVSGNHEWAAGAMPELAALLKECGVTYLSNTFVTLERDGSAITLAGIDDPNGYADQKTPQPGGRSDPVGPRTRRPVAAALHRRPVGQRRCAAALLYQRILHLPGRGRVCHPGPGRHGAGPEPPGGGGGDPAPELRNEHERI